jgi:antitoxin component of MazEF toxin-antitoxin module
MNELRKLKRYGGSVVLPLPPIVLKALGAEEGTTVEMQVDDRHRLIVSVTSPEKRYTLSELVALCDASSVSNGDVEALWRIKEALDKA